MPPENSQSTTNDRQQSFWKEFFKLVFLSVIIVIPFRLYIAQPFVVDGLSMYPTFDNDDYLIIDEISFRFRGPERGEVLVFKYPNDPKKYFIKRLIGLPNETVKIRDGEVTIVNAEYPEGLRLSEPYVRLPKHENLTTILEEDDYFVMGDNRASSADSRIWGALPATNIVGRPVFRLYPPDLFPGNYDE